MCMSCNKTKVHQSSGKGKMVTSNGSRRAIGTSMPSSPYGKPKVRFSGRGR